MTHHTHTHWTTHGSSTSLSVSLSGLSRSASFSLSGGSSSAEGAGREEGLGAPSIISFSTDPLWDSERERQVIHYSILNESLQSGNLWGQSLHWVMAKLQRLELQSHCRCDRRGQIHNSPRDIPGNMLPNLFNINRKYFFITSRWFQANFGFRQMPVRAKLPFFREAVCGWLTVCWPSPGWADGSDWVGARKGTNECQGNTGTDLGSTLVHTTGENKRAFILASINTK